MLCSAAMLTIKGVSIKQGNHVSEHREAPFPRVMLPNLCDSMLCSGSRREIGCKFWASSFEPHTMI